MKIILLIILSVSAFSESIVCSNHAIKSIVQEIVGRNHEIITIVEPKESPIGYHADADEIAKSGRADIIFYSSAYNENYILDLPSTKKFELASSIPEDKVIFLIDSVRADFWWLDPQITLEISNVIADTLSKVYPDKANKINANLNSFQKKLATIDNYIASNLSSLKFLPIYEEFPVLIYFTENFSLPYADYFYPKHLLPISPNDEFENAVSLTKADHLVYYSEKISEELRSVLLEYKLTKNKLYPYGKTSEKDYSQILKEITKEIKKVYTN